MKCKKTGIFYKDYKQGQKTNRIKDISILYSIKKLKGIRECIIKSFIFYYNDYYLVYQNTKYIACYQPQKPELATFKSTKKNKMDYRKLIRT